MDGPLHIGKIELRPGVSLTIIDCRSWYAVAAGARCRKGLDVSACASCEKRETRGSDMRNPPIYGRGDAPAPRPAPVPPSAQPAPPERIRGLGDVVHKVTSKLGIRECGGCKKRREALNKAVPFGKGDA